MLRTMDWTNLNQPAFDNTSGLMCHTLWIIGHAKKVRFSRLKINMSETLQSASEVTYM